MSKREFEPVLEEVRRLEASTDKSQWRLGNRILEIAPWGESSLKTDVYETIERLADAILEEGFDGYAPKYLQELRWCAHEFPATLQRVPWIKGKPDSKPVSFTTFRFAGSAKVFQEIYDAAPRGTRITKDYVLKVKDAWWDKERRAREKAEEDRGGNKSNVTSFKNRPSSKGWGTSIPTTSERLTIEAHLRITADICTAIANLEDHADSIKDSINRMEPEQVAELVEKLVQLQSTCADLLKLIPQSDRRSNIMAVG